MVKYRASQGKQRLYHLFYSPPVPYTLVFPLPSVKVEKPPRSPRTPENADATSNQKRKKRGKEQSPSVWGPSCFQCDPPVSAQLSVALLAIQDPQDSEEQVNDIEIEADRRGDFFLYVIMPHDELGVHQDISAEDEGGDDTVDQLNGATVWEEGSHESENDQDPQRTKEVGHPAREVVFSLACEEG